MSKLRADITYSHRLKSNDTSELTISDIDINELFINQNRENNTTDDNNTSIRKNNEIPIEEESDDEIDQTNTENEFNNYLQGWEDMLKEEEEAEADCEEDDTDSNHDSDNSNNLDKNSNIVDDIVHPAIDTNAKWILVNLFKNNLKLPF